MSKTSSVPVSLKWVRLVQGMSLNTGQGGERRYKNVSSIFRKLGAISLRGRTRGRFPSYTTRGELIISVSSPGQQGRSSFSSYEFLAALIKSCNQTQLEVVAALSFANERDLHLDWAMR